MNFLYKNSSHASDAFLLGLIHRVGGALTASSLLCYIKGTKCMHESAVVF